MRSEALPLDGSGRLRVIVFTVVAASFIATTLAIQRTSSDIDAFSDAIVSNSAPTIAHLASVRATTSAVELALWRYTDADAEQRESQRAGLDGALNRLNEEVRGYLTLPRFPGEQRHWAAVQQAWAQFDDAVKRTRDLVEFGQEAAARQASAGVEPRASRLVDSALSAIEFNADHGRSLAARIKETRRRANLLGMALTALCVVLAVGGALLMGRETRRRRALVAAYSQHIEARAAELEQFAGRVAHDIRNPLAAAQMGAELLIERDADASTRDLAQRIVRNLVHASAVIGGLLDFARSGARPDPGARVDVRAAIADLATDIGEAADRAGIQIRYDDVPPVLAGCSPGVYLSLLSNLVRNAIKYMGDAPVRTIRVRVVDEGPLLRTEVSDTGPGIPEANLPSLFTPYFRGNASGREGLGLGLATVKKLAEGHGGQVGVESVLARGSTFWFTLPRAGSATEASELEAPPGAEQRRQRH